MLDKKWICPKCGGDNTAFLPLVKKVTTYQLFRTGTQEYETFQIFASSSVADNAQPPQHTVYRCLDAPIFKSEPEKVNLDPAGLREHFVWRHLDKLYDALPERFHPSISFTTVSFSSHVNKKEPEYISPYEAAALSFVLSIDSITAGVSQGNSPLSPAVVFLFSSVIHFLSILLGTFAGRRLSGKLSGNLSFLPALLLFLLAISRLF